MSALVDPQRWCGQEQPHPGHRWVHSDGFYAQCAGHTGPANREARITEALIAGGLAEEPEAMTISHDRLVLQRAERDGGKVVVVQCPHTIGLCFELEEPAGFLGILPCPCNDRSVIVADVVPREVRS